MTEIHHMAGHLIRRINQISVSLFQDRMRAEGLDLTPVQFAALFTLRDHPGVDQATLAGMIAYDRATIGGVIDRLEAKNLVTRQTSTRDRRAREVRLTPEGAALLARVHPTVRAVQADILVGLNQDERTTFLALAEKVAAAGNHLSRAPLLLPDDHDRPEPPHPSP
ncbi:DNA-binding MarR family transcriptional regulator [Rhodobacteraceae bacterium MBR-64]|jgi:DNA-binding MarR family transcriptional regulator